MRLATVECSIVMSLDVTAAISVRGLLTWDVPAKRNVRNAKSIFEVNW